MPLTQKSLRGCLWHQYVSRFVEQAKVYGSSKSDLELYQEIGWHVVVKDIAQLCKDYHSRNYGVFAELDPSVFSKYNIVNLISGKAYVRPIDDTQNDEFIHAIWNVYKGSAHYQRIMDFCEQEYEAYLEHEASLLDTPRLNEAVLAHYDQVEKEID